MKIGSSQNWKFSKLEVLKIWRWSRYSNLLTLTHLKGFWPFITLTKFDGHRFSPANGVWSTHSPRSLVEIHNNYYFDGRRGVAWSSGQHRRLPFQGLRDRIPVFLLLFFGWKISLEASLLSPKLVSYIWMHDACEGKKACPANWRRRTGRHFRNGLRDSRKDELVRFEDD